MPEANFLSDLKESVKERVKERKDGWGVCGGGGGGVSILLKVTAESQPECLLFLRYGHTYVESVRFPAGPGEEKTPLVNHHTAADLLHNRGQRR